MIVEPDHPAAFAHFDGPGGGAGPDVDEQVLWSQGAEPLDPVADDGSFASIEPMRALGLIE
jgi:hypothetical protein